LVAHGIYFGVESHHTIGWFLLVLFRVILESIKVYQVGVEVPLQLGTFLFEVSSLATLIALLGWEWRGLDGVKVCAVILIDPSLVPIGVTSAPVVP
jgi:hypothetical protein